MSLFDVIVRGGEVVSGSGVSRLDVGISGGKIVALESDLAGSATEEHVAIGQTVLPGGVDPHVHFNEPGRTDWEGWSTGSSALAAGGITTCVEMPLNAHPPTINLPALEAKITAAEASSLVDFALWGGLTPDSLEHLRDLAHAGVIGFKAFMSSTGTDDFQRADDDTLFQGMQIAAELGLPVAVHAENDSITSGLARRAGAEGRVTMRDYLGSRPVIAEVEAIGRAIVMAEAAGCALHIVHVSTGQGVALVADARVRGVDVTCETCPHYLSFDETDAERIGSLAKCAPPIRSAEVRETLWQSVLAGDVDMIGSDHSPAPPDMKTSANTFSNWGGISGCQHLTAVTLSMGMERHVPLIDLVRMLATNAAHRFQLEGKGKIAIGTDADLVLWTLQSASPVSNIQYRHPWSAWDEVPVTWSPTATLLRGRKIFADGHLLAAEGRFLPGPLWESSATPGEGA